MNIRIVLLSAISIFLCIPASAEVLFLNDGARLEGEIAGRSDGKILLKTKYGSLSINAADVAKIALDDEKAKEELSKINPEAEIVNTKDLHKDEGKFVFSTVVSEDGSAKIFYFMDTEIIATETLDENAKFVSLTGNIPDRTFTEYHENGKVKTVKTMKNGKPEGVVLSYYNDGTLQIRANYTQGLKNGLFTFYSPSGKPMIEAQYKDDKLNGPKKDYNANGNLEKITWYKDDEITETPEGYEAAAFAEASKQSESQDSLEGANTIATGTEAVSGGITSAVADGSTSADKKKKNVKKSAGITVKAKKVARGTIYSFYQNNRYRGKAKLDQNYNVVMIDGSLPEGTARMYGKNDVVQLEFVFRNRDIAFIITYDAEGNETARYAINEKGVATRQ